MGAGLVAVPGVAGGVRLGSRCALGAAAKARVAGWWAARFRPANAACCPTSRTRQPLMCPVVRRRAVMAGEGKWRGAWVAGPMWGPPPVAVMIGTSSGSAPSFLADCQPVGIVGCRWPPRPRCAACRGWGAPWAVTAEVTAGARGLGAWGTPAPVPACCDRGVRAGRVGCCGGGRRGDCRKLSRASQGREAALVLGEDSCGGGPAR